jgi:hypothetical protein
VNNCIIHLCCHHTNHNWSTAMILKITHIYIFQYRLLNSWSTTNTPTHASTTSVPTFTHCIPCWVRLLGPDSNYRVNPTTWLETLRLFLDELMTIPFSFLTNIYKCSEHGPICHLFELILVIHANTSNETNHIVLHVFVGIPRSQGCYHMSTYHSQINIQCPS